MAPPLSKPALRACSVVLFKDRPFVGDAPSFAAYTPGCPGPWSKVILRLQTSAKGTQYDRLGAIWLDRAELMRFTTAEPTRHGISYTVEKDVTVYAPLMRSPGSVTVSLANYLSRTHDGVYRLTAEMEFYRAADAAHAAPLPGRIVPVENEAEATPWAVHGALAETLRALPRNISRARLDLYASNHDCDEFWYSNVPDAYAAAHKNDGLCGGGTYREIDVQIDGRAAYVVYPFPYIWTGGMNPLLWRPLPAIDALNVPPYEVDLNPWAGVLSDGKPHTIAISVYGNRGIWPLDGNLLLWQDRASASTGGAIEHDDFEAPQVFTADRLGGSGGTLLQSAIENWRVSGYVNTSRGRVAYSVATQMHFENRQMLELKTGEQKASQDTQVTSTYTTVEAGRVRKRTAVLEYPIAVDVKSPPLGAGSPYAYTINASVKQARKAVAGARSCTFTVTGSAMLERRKNGTDASASGNTSETYECSGRNSFNLSATARDGALLSHTSQRRTQWKSNPPTSQR